MHVTLKAAILTLHHSSACDWLTCNIAIIFTPGVYCLYYIPDFVYNTFPVYTFCVCVTTQSQNNNIIRMWESNPKLLGIHTACYMYVLFTK